VRKKATLSNERSLDLGRICQTQQ